MRNFIIEDGVLKKYTGKDTNIQIPGSVTSIGSQAFVLCRSLTSIEIPDSVMSIGESAFEGCDNLAEIINKSGIDI